MLSGVFQSFSTSTDILSGAIDVLVVEDRQTGNRKCTPFHVRFGRMKILRPYDKLIKIYVNNEPTDVNMKLGDVGEAYFCQELNDGEKPQDIPLFMQTSPIVSPRESPTNKMFQSTIMNEKGEMVSAKSVEDVSEEEETEEEEPISHLTEQIAQQQQQQQIPQQTNSSYSWGWGKLPSISGWFKNRNSLPASSSSPSLQNLTGSSVSPAINSKPLLTESNLMNSPSSPNLLQNSPTRNNIELKNENILIDHITKEISEISPQVILNSNQNSVNNLSESFSAITITEPSSNATNDGDDKIKNAIMSKSHSALSISGEDTSEVDYESPEESEDISSNSKFEVNIEDQEYNDESDDFELQSHKQPEKTSTNSSPQKIQNNSSNVKLNGQIAAAAPSLKTSTNEVPLSSSPSQSSFATAATSPPQKSWKDWFNFSPKPTTDIPKPQPVLKKSLRPTHEQLKSLKLKPGKNEIKFIVSNNNRLQGDCEIIAYIYLWYNDCKIVVSDVDGTITRSDVLGHVLPLIGKDWSHSGIAKLYNSIINNGYKILYLTSRSIIQAGQTRGYILNLKQGTLMMPEGPVIMAPDRLFTCLAREVIIKKPEEFKIAALRDVKALFYQEHSFMNEEAKPMYTTSLTSAPAEYNPFFAGFGNKLNDVIAYRTVGIPLYKIFTIDVTGTIKNFGVVHESYSSIHELANQIFPALKTDEEPSSAFSSFNYWRSSVHEMYDGPLEDL